MNRPTRPEQKPYFRIGLAILLLATLSFLSDARLLLQGPIAEWFTWQILSGFTLSLLLAFQFALLFARLFGTAEQVRRHYHWHRYLGIALTVLFALHAVRFGYAWTSALSLLFFASALSGLMNRETMRYRNKALYLFWYGIHVAVSTILVPVAVLHIWVALAFK